MRLHTLNSTFVGHDWIVRIFLCAGLIQLLCIVVYPLSVLAIATSTSYTIFSDSIGCGGGYSTSTGYTLLDAACETTEGGYATSTGYKTGSGFLAMSDLPFLTSSLSGGSIAFGTLSVTAIASSTVSVSVQTNAGLGYATSIISDGDFRNTKGKSMTNAGASDTISVGSGKYGFGTTGSDGQYNSADTGISSSTAKIFALSTGLGASSTTSITFKAAPSSVTAAGSYSQSLTIITTGTY